MPSSSKPRKRRSPSRSSSRSAHRSEDGSAAPRAKASGSGRATLRTVAAPKQKRSEKTLQRILDAAERLIVERGLRAVSIADVVRAAKSSVGGFYARFRDKEELLLALHERNQRELREEVLTILDPATWEAASLEEIVAACVETLVRRASERRRLMAAFVHSVATQPERWEEAITFRQRLIEGVSALLLSRREEMAHPDPEAAVRFAIQTALAIVDHRALFTDVDPSFDTDEGELRVEIERVVLRYLGVS